MRKSVKGAQTASNPVCWITGESTTKAAFVFSLFPNTYCINGCGMNMAVREELDLESCALTAIGGTTTQSVRYDSEV